MTLAWVDQRVLLQHILRIRRNISQTDQAGRSFLLIQHSVCSDILNACLCSFFRILLVSTLVKCTAKARLSAICSTPCFVHPLLAHWRPTLDLFNLGAVQVQLLCFLSYDASAHPMDVCLNLVQCHVISYNRR